MQATTRFHDGVPEPILEEADCILDDPLTFHPPNGVFHADADGGDTTIRGFLRGCQFSSRGCFLGLDDRHVLQAESLEALIVIQTAARWQGTTPPALPGADPRLYLHRCGSRSIPDTSQ